METGKNSVYDDPAAITNAVREGRHRDMIGGLWDEMGRLQLDYLRDMGLRPEHTLLDLGCGCLRAGVHFVRYLEAGHYYGMDNNQSLLDAGYEIELAVEGLLPKLPRDHLHCSPDFAVESFGRKFDFVIAQSLFTHLRLSVIRECLVKVAPALAPNGRFFATFFEQPESWSDDLPIAHSPGTITTYRYRDPYHCRVSELIAASNELPLKAVPIGEWGHPRGQRMMCFERKAGG